MKFTYDSIIMIVKYNIQVYIAIPSPVVMLATSVIILVNQVPAYYICNPLTAVKQVHPSQLHHVEMDKPGWEQLVEKDEPTEPELKNQNEPNRHGNATDDPEFRNGNESTESEQGEGDKLTENELEQLQEDDNSKY